MKRKEREAGAKKDPAVDHFGNKGRYFRGFMGIFLFVEKNFYYVLSRYRYKKIASEFFEATKVPAMPVKSSNPSRIQESYT